MIENYEVVNNLLVSVDWISFTVLESASVADVIRLMGYKLESFCRCQRGADGYKSQLKHSTESISILFNGNENMGIHVNISGSAISSLLSHYESSSKIVTPFDETVCSIDFDITVLSSFLKAVMSIGHLTRIDLAIDNRCNLYYTMPDLFHIFDSRQYVSKFRRWDLYRGTKNNLCDGYTIYLGKRSSEVFLRIYDKALEQGIDTKWVRWELELKKGYACRAAQHIVDGIPLSHVAVGILSNYLKIILPDSDRPSRCSTCPKWNEFVNSVSKLNLYVPKEKSSINQKKTWLFKQVAPSLSAVYEAGGGDNELIYTLLQNGHNRLKPADYELISEELKKYVN